MREQQKHSDQAKRSEQLLLKFFDFCRRHFRGLWGKADDMESSDVVCQEFSPRSSQYEFRYSVAERLAAPLGVFSRSRKRIII